MVELDYNHLIGVSERDFVGFVDEIGYCVDDDVAFEGAVVADRGPDGILCYVSINVLVLPDLEWELCEGHE